jgi:hypothetical protein
LGAVQNIAPIASDLYVDYKHYDTTSSGPAFDQIMGGVRVKF